MTAVRIQARTRVSVLRRDLCREPLDVFGEIADRDVRGSVFMESAARGTPDGMRSLIVPSGAVRLVARGSHVRLEALSDDGELVVSALGASRRFPVGGAELGVPDIERLKAPSILDAVRELAAVVIDDRSDIAMPPGVFGAFSYELVDCWESLPERPPSRWEEPDIDVVLALDTIVFDHAHDQVHVFTRSLEKAGDAAASRRHQDYVRVLTHGSSSAYPSPTDVGDKHAEPEVDDETFVSGVGKFLDHIERGEIFQGVLSRGLSMKSDADPLSVYRALRETNPSPYMFHVALDEGVLLGASPETSVKVSEGRVEIRPIAGTAPRGLNPDGTTDEELDNRLAVALLLDAKEQAEHAMLVDIARNDVARVSVSGTRTLAELFTIEKYSHVQHLVSAVTGELLPGLDALHAYRAAANMGTLTGAPKLRAMELIRETESSARGYYGGAVGYLLQDGRFDSCIVIRSLRYRPGGLYETRAGAGIVIDSDPARELAETEHKARACRRAVTLAEAYS